MNYLLSCHHYGQRYLSVRDFMEFCRSVGIHVTEETELEFYYEDNRRLCPVAKPDDYLRSTAEGGDMPNQFSGSIKKEPGQSLAHPVDEAFDRLPESLDPRQTQFHPWDSHVEVFYHYWQVYELYQIRRDKGLYAEEAFAVRCEDKWQFTPILYTVESTLFWNRPVAEGDYLGLHDDFDALSRFIYLYNQDRNRTFAPIQPNEDLIKSLSPGDYEQYKSRVMNIAKDISQQCELDEERLYAFMRKLMEMHYSYQQAERHKLADLMKRDIGSLMHMVEWITGQDSTHVAEKAGNLRRHLGGPNYLETIFPNARAKARDKAAKILTLWAKRHYNPYVTTPFVMNDTNLDALVRYIDETDLAIFEYVLFTLNETWWDIPDSTQSAAMYFCIKNLAAFPEAFLREVYNYRIASRAIKPISKFDLYNYACSLFAKESSLQSFWKVIQDGYNNKCHDAKTEHEFEQKFEHLRAKMDQPHIGGENYLGYCFLMAALVRNFTHHHLVAEDSSLFDNRYLRAIRAILSVVFFAWVYARHQGWEEVCK